MEVILRDSYPDGRMRKCILMDVIVPKLEHAGGGYGSEFNVKLVNKMETM